MWIRACKPVAAIDDRRPGFLQQGMGALPEVPGRSDRREHRWCSISQRCSVWRSSSGNEMWIRAIRSVQGVLPFSFRAPVSTP